MRQAFLIGAIILWVGITMLGSIAEMVTPMQNVDAKTGLTEAETLEEMRKPEMTDANMITVFTKIGSAIMLVGRVIFLWHPALWQGDAIYIYYVFLAIGISFWYVFLMGIRGVGSS